ncbi:hypothetical protein, partial [Arachidicoccus sp.]|mgnify:FL=1|uniref:hypothetical protein n=1 Tax=Arachidicoccus sp. TaxID=1872624 RepID=UPI003D24270C
MSWSVQEVDSKGLILGRSWEYLYQIYSKLHFIGILAYNTCRAIYLELVYFLNIRKHRLDKFN